jgi:hypothetical protein
MVGCEETEENKLERISDTTLVVTSAARRRGWQLGCAYMLQ